MKKYVVLLILTACLIAGCAARPHRPTSAEFNGAVDAIRTGDRAAMEKAIAGNPTLVNFQCDGISLLSIASVSGQIDILKLLVEKGANVNSVEREGCTPLHVAAYAGQEDVAQFLIARGANLNARTTGIPPRDGHLMFPRGTTPLKAAELYHKKSMVNLLQKHGGKVR